MTGSPGDEVPVPKYLRVKAALLAQMASGNWAAGALIPSEPVLCEHFGVSRTTVRKAVSDLASEGRLATVQGRGTFVVAPKLEERFVQRAFGLYEDLERRGITLATQVLRQEVVNPPSSVQRKLGLDRRNQQVHLLVRRRLVEGRPVVVSTTYIPRSLCPGLAKDDLSQGSLYRLLAERYDLAIAYGERRLEAVASGPEEARLLDIALSSPVLLLESIAYLRDGRPFEHSVALHRGDQISAQVEFFASNEDLVTGLRSTTRVNEERGDGAQQLVVASLRQEGGARPPKRE
jgi:GntR family transcriptional regulator